MALCIGAWCPEHAPSTIGRPDRAKGGEANFGACAALRTRTRAQPVPAARMQACTQSGTSVHPTDRGGASTAAQPSWPPGAQAATAQRHTLACDWYLAAGCRGRARCTLGAAGGAGGGHQALQRQHLLRVALRAARSAFRHELYDNVYPRPPGPARTRGKPGARAASTRAPVLCASLHAHGSSAQNAMRMLPVRAGLAVEAHLPDDPKVAAQAAEAEARRHEGH